MATIGVAVIGYGRMGLIHAQNVQAHPRLQLKYIIGTQQSKIDAVITQFPNVIGTTDISQALKDPSVGAFVVCSPSGVHYSNIIDIANAGKAIFCEKPIALTEEEITKCFEAAEKNNVPLLCGYQRRFDDSIARIHEMIPNQLGDIQLLRLTSRDHPAPPEEYLSAGSTGSFFDDFSTHDVDIARWMVKEDPSSIYATASNFTGGDDTAVVVLKFPSGALCVIDNSRQTTYGYDVRMEVLGTKGMATLLNPRQSSVIFSSQHGHSTDVAHYSFPERFAQAYKAELDHFVQVLDRREPLRVARHDCVQACRITATAQLVRSVQPATPKISSFSHPDVIYPTLSDAKGPIGVVIFGTGRMGRVRARALEQIPGVNVIYGFDIIEASVQSFAKDFNCQGYVLTDEKMEEALKDERVHVVFVSTTSSSHFKIITSSLNAGKHVFAEKPLALTAADTKVCVDLANAKNLGLYCGFQRRSDLHFRKLKQSITGKKQLIRITSREPASLSGIAYLLASGGFLFDSVIHDFDMACYLSGEYPFEVYCQANAFNPTLKEAGDVDAIVVVLRFPSGAIASIDNHRNALYGYDQRAEVHTSTGQYSTENLGLTTVQVADTRGFTTDNPPDCLVRYEHAYINETEHFIALLRGEEKEARSNVRDYVVTARIAEAARESLKLGKAVPFDSSE